MIGPAGRSTGFGRKAGLIPGVRPDSGRAASSRVCPATLWSMSTFYQLDFEREMRRVEQQIEAAELRLKSAGEPTGVPPGVPLPAEEVSPDQVPTPELPAYIESLRERLRDTTRHAYSQLSPWDTVRVARHP